jgi:DNA-directed RNA polymerase subunit RPC12/RpoP
MAKKDDNSWRCSRCGQRVTSDNHTKIDPDTMKFVPCK